MDGMLDVSNVDLVKLAKEAYALSRPRGMGYLHYQEGELADEDAQELVRQSADDNRIALSMDYVRGRACKLSVLRQDGKLWMRESWFDHSTSDMAELRKRVGF